ncbi:MAG: hypothetical protein Hens2KO_30720 [Henriciella sp.]
MAKSKSKYSYNPNPRLSANQLAEIVNASPTRRKSIIVDAKFPKSVVVAKYREAMNPLKSFLGDPKRNVPNFADIISGLEAKSIDGSLTPWTRVDAANSAEALGFVHSAYNKTGLGKFDLRPLPLKQPKVVIEGVEVGASAALSVHGTFKNKPAVGCLSLLFNKSEPSTNTREERCKAAAVLSVLYSEQHLSNFGYAAPKLSMSYDVFLGKVIVAPNTYKKRLDNMRFACEDVVLHWPTIDPPHDYDGPPV